MSSLVRIGTRESDLAVWQATQVQEALQRNGIAAELVRVKSEGDQDLVTPLYAFGVQGIFTRNLDAALLNERIDIAVHSMKDVPVELANGIEQLAVMKRGPWEDTLILNEKHAGKDWEELSRSPLVIATSSIRRRAQWLHRHPHHTMTDLRGNMATRLRKIHEQDWDGAIFAKAGLARIGLLPEQAIPLDWMMPAPAQGAVMVVCRSGDAAMQGLSSHLNDRMTALCVKAERDFLSALLGGCSTPISGHARVEGDQLYFRGNIFTPDGKESSSVELSEKALFANPVGKLAAEILLGNGGAEIVNKINKHG
jgi:hydroxymethylbilane synthase